MIEFRLKSNARGKGRAYFSGGSKAGFNRESSVEFEVHHDDQWHEYRVDLPTKKLNALRLDPATAEGSLRVSTLRLLNARGDLVKQWPEKRR